MKVYLTDKISGEPGALCVAEIEFTSTARRVRVQAMDGLEALDLRGERPGGLYDAAATLQRLHVPLRVTKTRSQKARVMVTVEDAAGVVAPETWEGVIALEGVPAKAGGGKMLAAFFAVAAAIVWFVVLPMMKPPAVPSLKGKKWRDADSALRAAGFASVVLFREATSADEADRVLEQYPDADERAPKGSPVKLVVGRAKGATGSAVAGTTLVDVPAVVGLPLAQAEAKLAGLVVTTTPRDAPDDQVGRVLEQKPPALARVSAGTSVELVVGRAAGAAATSPQAPLVAPKVVGMLRAEAEEALKAAGIQAKVIEKEIVKDAPESVDRVIAQYPESGDRVTPGGSVEITVGRAPSATPATSPTPTAPPTNMADVPDVVGQLRADAERAITDAGLTPVIVAAEPTEGAADIVVSQDPMPGKAPPRSNVTLRVPTTAPVAVAPVPAMGTDPTAPPPVHPTPTQPPSTTGPGPTAMGETVPSTTTPIPGSPANPLGTGPTPSNPTAPAQPPPATPDPGVTKPAAAPDLIGLSRAAAEFELKKLGLEARVWEEELADTPPGMVLRQTPPAGDPVLGGAVELTVSKKAGSGSPSSTPTAAPHSPNATARMAPDVIGRVEADAIAALNDAGIGFRIDREDVAPERAGLVIRQEPVATVPLVEGVKVVLTIGRGTAVTVAPPALPPPAIPPPSLPPPAIPPVRSNPPDVPGFTATPRPPPLLPPPTPGSPLPPPTRRSRSGPAPAGSSRSTGPTSAPTTTLPPATSQPNVSRPTVSAPPPPATAPYPSSTPTTGMASPALAIRPTQETVVVPDFSGRDAAEAVEVALRAGLVPTTVPDRDVRAPVGRVRLQDPAPGAAARAGSTVTLNVGSGYSGNMVDVPSVVGLSSADAAARLGAAGFSSQLMRTGAKPGLFANPDQVVGQTPAGRVAADAARIIRIFLP